MSGRMGYKYLFSTFEIHDVPIEGAASPDGATPRNALDNPIQGNFDLRVLNKYTFSNRHFLGLSGTDHRFFQ